jgi:hypothetical protein
MPLDYTAIQSQLHILSGQIVEKHNIEHEQVGQAAIWLDSLTGQNEQSRAVISQAAAGNTNLRSAIPTDEEITSTFLPPLIVSNYTLFAADGSQVHPSRHDAIPFGVINIGVFRLSSNNQTPPAEIFETKLLTLDELYTEYGLVGEEVIALKRDLAERKKLASLAGEVQGSVLALTDGPLELFRDPEGNRDTQKEFEEYLGVLHQLAGLGTITAGYVDRPGSDLVVRMLEILHLPADELANAGRSRPLAPLSDASLFQTRISGSARSAIFAIQSRSAQQFKDETALHFFYLNTGTTENPSLARVEIPAWVASNKTSVDLLHAVLIDQCRHLGTRPYPYALHRSHEIALVSFADKGQIETMISRAILARGLNPPAPSNKQFAKSLTGRTRIR